MSRLVLLGTVAFCVVSACGTQAADLRSASPPIIATPALVQPAFNWTGYYVGANAGYGWGHACWTYVGTNLGPAGPLDEGCHDTGGALVGGHFGYNWQAGLFVFGLEAQGDWANLKGSSLSLAFDDVNRTRVDALGLFTGKVGFAANNVLYYVKGGGAVAHNKADFYAATLPGLPGSTSYTRWGWVFGGGLEFGFTPNWSFGVEYDYVGLGSRHEQFSGSTNPVDDIKQNLHLFTGRLNYRFGGPTTERY